MNLKEARTILEISEGASQDEAKRKYRELTKKYHPDINKEPGAEDKFKKINEAYQCVSSGKGTDREEIGWQDSGNPFGGFPFGVNPFGNRSPVYQVDNINLETTISFKESVIGCQKNLKFNRKTKCKDCNGQGVIAINNGCDKCGGKGQIVNNRGGMVFIQTCDKCYGRTQANACKICNKKGTVDAEASINVTIPGGVQNSNSLRLGGVGHYIGNFGPLEQHTDAHLRVNVISEPGLILDGNTVISNISISLLEALQGCKKTVNTIMGNKEIEIKPKSRNKDEVILPKLGVNLHGDQKIILDVQYPEDVNILIEKLSSISERTV
jgi:molecular chaperone DnaJ